MPHTSETILYGHLCKDRIPETQTYEPGSPVWYIAHVLSGFHMNPTIISPYGLDYPRDWLGPVALVPDQPTASETLIYENKYMADGTRKQHAFNADKANPVQPEETQRELWRHAKAIFVCPILDNISASNIAAMKALAPDATFALLPQGYFRKIEPNGLVNTKAWDTATEIVPFFDVIFVSEQDGPDMHETARYWSTLMTGRVIVTQAASGCVLYGNGSGEHIPSEHIQEEKHPTGAGDVFAASYIYDFLRHRNAETAVRFATHIAARHVAGMPIDLSDDAV